MRALGRLLRLSLAPSAVADVAAGVVLGAGTWAAGAAPWLLVGGSLAVYHGGLALNDWADRARDARERPERPLPSGEIAAPLALALALALLVLGPVLGALASPRAGLLLAAVAVLAAVYDLVGRGPWLGPLLLALCRAGNLGAGVLVGRLAAESQGPALGALLPLAYGVYVLVVSRLGRLEDREDALDADGRQPRRLLTVAGLLLLAPGLGASIAAAHGGPALVRPALATLLGILGALGLWRLVRRTERWTPEAVVPAMGMALRRLLVFTSACALAGSTDAIGTAVALAILLGFPLSHALRHVFPPS